MNDPRASLTDEELREIKMERNPHDPMVRIIDGGPENILVVNPEGAMMCEDLGKFIGQLNLLGGYLFFDQKTGKTFRIVEVDLP